MKSWLMRKQIANEGMRQVRELASGIVTHNIKGKEIMKHYIKAAATILSAFTP